MLNDGSGTSSRGDHAAHITSDEIRDIHALISPPPPPPPLPAGQGRRREAWETSSHRSANLSVSSEGSSEQFTTMSGEFNALVLAGSTIQNDIGRPGENTSLARIGEDQEETNPLAIVPDNAPFDPVASPRRGAVGSSLSSSSLMNAAGEEVLSVQRVKKEEVESKISAWQTAKIAKINNRFKREDAVINGWESEEVQRATTWFKKEERKLEEKRARAMEKMQNEVAKARRKAEEKRASAESKRGTKAAKVLELASLMRAMGRAPIKRSFF